MALRKETVSALVKVISSDPEKLTSLVVKGFNKFGEEITETIMVPTDGSVATTNNVFYGETSKNHNA